MIKIVSERIDGQALCGNRLLISGSRTGRGDIDGGDRGRIWSRQRRVRSVALLDGNGCSFLRQKEYGASSERKYCNDHTYCDDKFGQGLLSLVDDARDSDKSINRSRL